MFTYCLNDSLYLKGFIASSVILLAFQEDSSMPATEEDFYCGFNMCWHMFHDIYDIPGHKMCSMTEIHSSV